MANHRSPNHRPLSFRFLAALFAAALLLAWVALPFAGRPSVSFTTVPAGLTVPSGLSGADLNAWCTSRLAEGTAGLSANAVNWLDACAEASAPTPSPSPSDTGSPTPTPTPSATTPSAAPSATTPAPTATPSPTATPTPTGTPTATSSPTASPSATGPCLPQPDLCGLPDATNTGVPTGTALTASSGDSTVRNDGAVIQGMDITGCITVEANNVTIRDSVIHCAGPYGIFNNTTNSATGLVIQNVEVDCMGNGGTTAIAGHNFAASEVNLHSCENGLDMGNNTSVMGSYVHDLSLVGAGHTDGIQSGGQGVTIQGNTIENATNGGTSAIITDPSSTANFVISGNLLSDNGGAYVVYCPRTTSSGFQVTGNRFARANDYAYSTSCANPWVSWSGNEVDATGAPLAADSK